LLVRFPCNTASSSVRRTPSSKRLEPPRETLNMSPKPVPKKVSEDQRADFAPIHFNAWRAEGRTRQSAGPPSAIAALRALQVRHEDVAEEAGVQEIGMWPM
jgi:hypothetical protein